MSARDVSQPLERQCPQVSLGVRPRRSVGGRPAASRGSLLVGVVGRRSEK